MNGATPSNKAYIYICQTICQKNLSTYYEKKNFRELLLRYIILYVATPRYRWEIEINAEIQMYPAVSQTISCSGNVEV